MSPAARYMQLIGAVRALRDDGTLSPAQVAQASLAVRTAYEAVCGGSAGSTLEPALQRAASAFLARLQKPSTRRNTKPASLPQLMSAAARSLKEHA